MRKHFIEIINEYPIQEIIQIEALDKGNTSEANIVISTEGKYILRKLKSNQQARTEYFISNILSDAHVSPKVLLTKKNKSFVEKNGGIYNLQQYINNKSVLNKNIHFQNLGKAIALFHHKMNTVNEIEEQEDRFSLEQLWGKVMEQPHLYRLIKLHGVTQLVHQILNYQHKDNCYIHADLGKWNLLFNEDDVYIIDFGEARRGNYHFDVAAVIASTIDLNQTSESILKNLVQLEKGYVENHNKINWTSVIENLYLWNIRGMLAFLCFQGKNNQQNSLIIKQVLDRNERLTSLIERFFIKDED
ncbi:phosphotransferase [Oceanobacillus sp. FSL W8-0428]|uniref:phosphotransferase n=1 Tax=Oceanobacillus TaxID=182709 RepID=UPI0030DA100B